MLLQSVILGSQNATSAVNGATTEPRIHINRPDDENARCRVSRVRVQPKNFSQPTQPLTTLSTSNAISPPQKRTEPSGPRRCRRGATSSPRREPNMPADLLRALFGNVTVPFGLLCRSLYRDQYASQIVPSLPADPMLGEPAADPEEKRGPASDKKLELLA